MKKHKMIVAGIVSLTLAASCWTSALAAECSPGTVRNALEQSVAVSPILSGDYEYEVNGDGSLTITDYVGSSSDLAVPGELDGFKVTSIGDGAFYNCSSLDSVTIPGSVTSIGERAFYRCGNLARIVLPGSVVSIGEEAFGSCRNLTDVTIPNSVTSLGGAAFAHCSGLISASIPDSVTSIDEWTFGGCVSLSSIIIPASVAEIGESAFAGCTSLKTMTAYSTLKKVDSTSFNSVSLDLLTYHGTHDEYYAEGNQLRQALVPQPREILFDQAQLPPATDIPALKPGHDWAIQNTTQGLMLTGIPAGENSSFTSVGEVRDQFDLTAGTEAAVLKADGADADADAPIATGDVVRLTAADGSVQTVTVVVANDVLGTGILGINQVVRLAKALLGVQPLEGAYLLAGAGNGSQITIADLVRVAAILSK